MNLGKAIKLCRIQFDLTQSDLATRAGISVSYLSLLEQGKRDPTFSTIEGIANSLNVPPVILIFLATDEREVFELSPELRKELSFAALNIIQ